MPQQLSTNTFGPAKFIVAPSSTPWLGTHTTISSAITSAAALGGNQTIAILPGTYTENPTLQPGINLTAWGSDSSQGGTGTVVIIGKLSFSSAGTVNIYGIQLQTNGDYCIEVTGSASSRVELTNCYVNCSNNTGLHITSSVGTSYISLLNCNGDIGITGISFFDASGGNVYINDSYITNSGSSVTASTLTGTGSANFQYSNITFPVTSTSSSPFLMSFSRLTVSNTTAFTFGSGTLFLEYSTILTGTATAIIVNTPANTSIANCSIASTNASVMSGTGGGNVFNCTFPQTTNISFSTFTNRGAQGCVGGAPFVSAIGEQINSYVPVGSAITLTNNTAANITSISLSPGNWDITAIGNIAGTLTGTASTISISDTSATLSPNDGDQTARTPISPTAASPITLTVPSFRVFLTTTTTYYLVAAAAFTVGTATAYGRISAVRSG